jgi:16S rRNA (uracil1498-N3)-methyltransferase
MRRFTIAPERISGDRVAFDADETRHLVRVLRLGPGDVVTAADGRGGAWEVRLLTLGDTATGAIVGAASLAAESPLAISLVQAVPKGDRMEAIVRATTELGVARILPALTERTVVRLDGSRWRERARRWQRVAREATKQCGRAVVPVVETPRPLAEWIATDEPADLRLCLWETEGAPLRLALAPLWRVIETGAGRPRSARVIVGPEGGLTREEVARASAAGYVSVTLGQRILRTETAGPAIVALLQYGLGDLGSQAP